MTPTDHERNLAGDALDLLARVGPGGVVDAVGRSRLYLLPYTTGEPMPEWVGVEFRRGFVERVTAPLDALLPPCGRCENGRVAPHLPAYGDGPFPESEECDHCSGTGRDPGVLRKLFGAQPVTAVTVSHREPICSEGSMGCDARWRRQTRDADSPWVLPSCLFDRLPHRLARYVRDDYHQYESLPDSRAALSAAVVAYGRSVAGLPAIAGRSTTTTEEATT